MLHLSPEAVAWTVTLVVALAIVGLVTTTARRWRHRPSGCGVDRDMREDSRLSRCAQTLASDIDKRPTLQEPGHKARLSPNDEAFRSAIGSEAGYSNWAVFLMRATFFTLSTIFGAFGIFLLYLSWFTRAEFSAYGLILLGSATCIVFSLQHGAWIRRK